MRVISQDGYTDIPYEDFVFSATDDWKIKVAKDVVYTTGQGKLRVIAEYSSREKVLKVIELLREEYLKYMRVEGGESPFTGQATQPNIWVIPKVFRFPADDEVKV